MPSAQGPMLHVLRRAGISLAMTIGTWALCMAAASAGIGTASITPVSPNEAQVTLSHSGYTPYAYTDGDSAGYKYRICWKDKGDLTIVCYTNLLNSNSPTFRIQNLTEGETIKLRGWCYCRQDSPPHFKFNRVIVEMDYTHHAPPPAPGLVSSTTVRLRNVQTNKCLFLEHDGRRARAWGCWADPAMRFALETYSDGHQLLRHLNSGNCLYAGWPIGFGFPTESNAEQWVCGLPGTSVEIVDQGSGNVWIRFPLTTTKSWPYKSGPGGCVLAGPSDGDDARKRTCQSDPALLFKLDPA